MARVIVTGAAGFIGSHVVAALCARGDEVLAIDNFDALYPRAVKENNLIGLLRQGHKHFRFAELDICDADTVAEAFGQFEPETVIHLAGRAGVRPSIANPSGWMYNNVIGTQVVLSAAHEAGVPRVVCASSSSVYGNCKVAPFAETLDVSEPISPYAASKRACELLGYTHHHLTGQHVAMLRFFTVFGPQQRPDLAISIFLDKVATGQALPVFGSLQTARDYTYISDIVRGVLSACKAIDAHGYRIWNLGSDRPVSLGEMIAAIGKVVGREPILDLQPQRAGDVDRTWADLKRSRAELGYNPQTTFADGLALQWQAQQAAAGTAKPARTTTARTKTLAKKAVKPKTSPKTKSKTKPTAKLAAKTKRR